jgi:oligopeptide transport system ATP-binding protein
MSSATACVMRSMCGRVELAPLLEVDDLCIGYHQGGRTLEAVRRVSLGVEAGECVGIVGESGSGKTQVFMAAMGLLAGNAAVSGQVRFEGRNLLGLGRDGLNRVRGSKLTMIFQDPMTSLTPHLKIGTQLAEVLVCHAGRSWAEARVAARRMLERVRVPEPLRRLNQYPHELSGGLRQRVMIGMSLMCGPRLVIADEPTTALDVTVQAEIIDLLCAIRSEAGMALVLISHDLAVVAGLADRILVMYAGRVVESAGAAELFRQARHPYTAELLKCIPTLTGPRLARLPTLLGQPPRMGEAQNGCAFAPRCPRAAERCRAEQPTLQPLGTDAAAAIGTLGDLGARRKVACHFPVPP